MSRRRARHWLGLALPALLVVAASAMTLAGVPPSTTTVPSAADAEAIQRASAIGQKLYDYDQAASISTDALLAQVPRDQLSMVRGWVVEPAANGALAVTYFSGEGSPRAAVFIATVTGGKVTASYLVAAGTTATLTLRQERLAAAVAAARSKASTRGWQPCTPARFNTVVLPSAVPGGPVSVYLLSPQVTASELPFGGHYRVDVAADGDIVAERSYTKACLTMPRPDAEAVGVVVSHLMDPTPTEIHVFTSLSARLPVFVAAPTLSWKVDGASITVVEEKASPMSRR